MKSLINQFNLRHFWAAQAMGDDDVFTYDWHTIHGLMRVDEVNHLIEIIAVANEVPHNGKYVEFIELLEKSQDDGLITFGVSEFFNTRLRSWFERRGYKYQPESDTMFYKKIPLTQRNDVDTIKT